MENGGITILPDLQQLRAAGESFEREAAGESESPGVRDALVTDRLTKRSPKLLALHTPAIGQVLDIYAGMAAHLALCQMIHRAFEDGMNARRAHQQAVGAAFAARPSPPMANLPQITQPYADWRLCVEHATLADYFLDRLVFSPWPRWLHRGRMRWFPNDLDRRSAALLKTGVLPEPAVRAAPEVRP